MKILHLTPSCREEAECWDNGTENIRLSPDPRDSHHEQKDPVGIGEGMAEETIGSLHRSQHTDYEARPYLNKTKQNPAGF